MTTSRDHDTSNISGLDCWCLPDLYVPCPECGPRMHGIVLHGGAVSVTRDGDPCARCVGGKHAGMLMSDRTTALMDGGCLVVHREQVH